MNLTNKENARASLYRFNKITKQQNDETLLSKESNAKPFFALTDNANYAKHKSFAILNVKVGKKLENTKLPSILTGSVARVEEIGQYKQIFSKNNPNRTYNKKLQRLLKTKKISNSFDKIDIFENALIFLKSSSDIQAFIFNEQLGVIMNKLRRTMRLIQNKKELIDKFKQKINKIIQFERNRVKHNDKADFSCFNDIGSFKDLLGLYAATKLVKKQNKFEFNEDSEVPFTYKKAKMDNLFLLLKSIIVVMMLTNELCRLFYYFYCDLPDTDKEKFLIVNKDIKVDLEHFKNYFHLFEFTSFKLDQNFQILFEMYENFKFQTQVQKIKPKKMTSLKNTRYMFLILQNLRVSLEDLHYRVFSFDDLIKL